MSGARNHFRMKKHSLKQETTHLTESRRDKAFRGFRNVVPTPANDSRVVPEEALARGAIELSSQRL